MNKSTISTIKGASLALEGASRICLYLATLSDCPETLREKATEAGNYCRRLATEMGNFVFSLNPPE